MKNKYLLLISCLCLVLCTIPHNLCSKDFAESPVLSFLTKRIQVLGEISKDTVGN